MTPTLPTNFNDTDKLIDYGKDLGITVGLGFLVPALVLSLILIIVFVKFCGGSSETRDKFTSKSRTILLALAIVVLIFAIVSCALAWSYNTQCHTGVESGSTTLQGVILDSAAVMINVNHTVNQFKDQLLNAVDQTIPIVGNVSTLLVPLKNILGVVGNIDSSILNLTSLTVVIAKNITAIKKDIGNLQEMEAEGIINGVPSVNDIPNIDSQYTNALNSSISSLQSVSFIVDRLSDNVNNTLNSVATTISDQLIAQTEQYNQKADEAVSYFLDFYHHITHTNTSYNKYSSDVVHYSSIRKSVIAGILVLPITLTALSLLGIFLKMKVLIKIAAAFCFIFMFWYFLLAGINFAGYYTLEQFCNNRDEIVGNAISIDQEEITVPGTNVTIKVSQKVILLLKCAGNTTLIDIFEFSFLINDVTGAINTQLDSINAQVEQLNQTEQYDEGLADLLSMENNSANLDFLRNSSLPTVHSDLRNISTELNDTINNPAYVSSLDAVNNITNNLTLTNGTIIHFYYDSSNITMLNCTTDPYDKLSQSVEEDLCSKAAIAISLTLVRNKAIAKSAAIYGNITDINERLYGFESTIPTIDYYQNQTRSYATEINNFLTDAFNRATRIIVEMQQMIQYIAGLISTGTSDIMTSTQCAYVGDAYTSLSKNLCTDVRDSLEAISAAMIVGACLFFVSTIIGMVTVYKIDKDLSDPSSDY